MKRCFTHKSHPLLVGVVLTVLGGYGLTADTANDDSGDGDRAASETLVDCELPGKVKKIGPDMSYLTPQRRVKISAKECKKKGGKVTSGAN